MNEGVIGACELMRAATSSGFIPDVNDLFEPEEKKEVSRIRDSIK